MIMVLDGAVVHSNDNLEDLIERQADGQDSDVEDDYTDENAPNIVYSILAYGSDPEVEMLQKRIGDGTYTLPEFQRGYVWTKKRASQFIESLLLGLPVPGIFLFRDEKKKKLFVLDGHQRLMTLRKFYSGEFDALTPFSLSDVQSSLLDKTYLTLSEEEKGRLDSAIIHATIIQQQTPEEEDKSSIYKIFQRINSGSVPLTPHEIRVSVNYDSFVKLLKDLNGNENWRHLFGPINKRMKDQELILRILAFSYSSTEYKGSMLSFLDSYLEANATIDEAVAEEMKENFEATMALLREKANISHPFKLSNAINAALLDSISTAVYHGVLKDAVVEDLDSQIEKLKLDDDYLAASTKSTNNQRSVYLRQYLAHKYLTNLTDEVILTLIPSEKL